MAGQNRPLTINIYQVFVLTIPQTLYNRPEGRYFAAAVGNIMARLIGAFYLVTLAFTQVAGAEELDFPSNGADDYSLADFHSFACVRDDLVRLVYIEYGGSVGEAPCSVVYEKQPPETSAREILWQAEHSTSYCELRAREFVEMLRGWNWKCGLSRDVLSAID